MRLQCGLNVVPEIDRWIELEHATTLNGVQIILVQEVENDVLAQARPDQSRQPHDQMSGKVRLDEGFQIAAMQAIGL